MEEKRLDAAIKASKISEEKICATADVTKANLNKYRSESACPNVLVAVRLARALGLKVEDIWG